MNLNEHIKNFFIGMIIGVANIIPGVSGGTMMVICKVFDKIMHAVGFFWKEFKKSVIFLLPIVAGAGIGILLFASGINYLLQYHYMVINFFFMGIIVGSFPMIYKKSVEQKFNILQVIPMLVTAGIMIAMIFILPSEESQVIRTINISSFVKLLAYSAISAFCMIIPGISGSFVMLLFGAYETVTTAISEFNIMVLIPVAIGVAIGIVLGSAIIDKLIQKFPNATYFAILGFMVGSIPTILFKIRAENAYVGGLDLVIATIVFILGIGISYWFSKKDTDTSK